MEPLTALFFLPSTIITCLYSLYSIDIYTLKEKCFPFICLAFNNGNKIAHLISHTAIIEKDSFN